MDNYTNFIALDLELNQDEHVKVADPKIVQVGVCIGNRMQSEEEYLVKKWYVNISDPVYPFITKLTGITQEDIQTFGVSHSVIGKELRELINQYNVFVNPVTWGGGDSSELLNEFKQNNVNFPHFGRRWIDVKTMHVMRCFAMNKSPSGGLSSAMGQYKLQFEGNAHRADVDAFNTLRLFFRILERQSMYEGITNLMKGM
jgi:inhibitor of KinA sporulation pathway (predicted exonuclease)